MGIRSRSVVLLSGVLAFLATGVSTASPPPVSPGVAGGVARVATSCPTFTWGAVAGAEAHEIVVYAVNSDRESLEADPVLKARVPGSASAWVPPGADCLANGERFAWSVRAVFEDATSEWSQPRLFEVPDRIGLLEFERALAVVTEFLAAGAGEEPTDSADDTEASKEAQGPSSTPGAIGPGESGSPIPNSFSVDDTGGISAPDLYCPNCVDFEDLSFDTATQAELDSHDNSSSAHHVQTVDTTCDGAACNGQLFTNVQAATGDSATNFFSSGTIAEARISSSLARDSELVDHLIEDHVKLVFVTLAFYNGSLGGLSGADSLCQAAANASDIIPPGKTFKAWLGGSATSEEARDRLSQFPGRYVRTDSVKVADSWTDLTDGSLDNPINKTENGTTPSSIPVNVPHVWTNASTNGGSVTNGGFCGTGGGTEWVSNSQFEGGRRGEWTRSNSQWTNQTNHACNNLGRLYCFEQ